MSEDYRLSLALSKKYNMKFAKIFKNKLFYLITGIILNILVVLGSLSFPTSVDKINYAPFNFFWEFFTVNWCVWNSVLTVIYNINEIKNERQKADFTKKRQRDFGLLVAISNSVAMLVFTAALLLKKNLLPADRTMFWWINSLTWHYVAPLISLVYFFQFVKLKKSDFNKKTLLWIAFPLPIFFFLANLSRRFLEHPEYLGGTLKFKKFLVPPFEWVEKGEFTLLSLFIVFSLLGFWLLLYLLLKIKRKYFPKTVYQAKERKFFPFAKRIKN